MGGHLVCLEGLVCGELIILFKSALATNHSFHGSGTVMATKGISENKMSLSFFISTVMAWENCFPF